LGARGLKKLGKKKWRKTVEFWVERFTSALLLDDVVIGGGNATKLKPAPPGSAATPTRSLAGFACGSRRRVARLTLPKGLVMTRQRKRKDHAHEENELIADCAPGMEGARCPP
jgi:hypothetical protein